MNNAIVKGNFPRPRYSETMRKLAIGDEYAEFEGAKRGSIDALASKLKTKEGMHFTVSADGNKVYVQRIA